MEQKSVQLVVRSWLSSETTRQNSIRTCGTITGRNGIGATSSSVGPRKVRHYKMETQLRVLDIAFIGMHLITVYFVWRFAMLQKDTIELIKELLDALTKKRPKD